MVNLQSLEIEEQTEEKAQESIEVPPENEDKACSEEERERKKKELNKNNSRTGLHGFSLT